MSLFPHDVEQDDVVYAREAALVDASEAIADALESSGVKRSELAKILGVSRGEITRRLRGSRNMTVATLAETLLALSHRLELQAVPLSDNKEARMVEPSGVSDRLLTWEFEDSETLHAGHESDPLGDSSLLAWSR